MKKCVITNDNITITSDVRTQPVLCHKSDVLSKEHKIDVQLSKADGVNNN